MTEKTYLRTYYGRAVAPATVDDLIWEVATCRGCLDYDRCNEHFSPQGGCDDCISDTVRLIDELRVAGISVERAS